MPRLEPRTLCMLAGALYAGLACAFAQPAVMHVDGNSYFEMARAFDPALGFSFDNGWSVVDSIELYLPNSVRMGDRLVAKYPAFYPLFGLPAYALLGVRGLSVINALAMGACVPLLFLIARRLMTEKWAAATAIAAPLVTQLFSYGLVAIPHALAACLVLGTVALALEAREREREREWESRVFAALAGLVGILAVGVRFPTMISIAVVPWLLLVGVKRDRVGRTLAFAAPLLIGGLLMGWINSIRFGVFAPISYGPPGHLGSPIELESIGALVTRLDFLGVAASGLVIVVGARLGLAAKRGSPEWISAISGSVFAIAVLLLVPVLRDTLVDLLASAFAMIVDHSVLVDEPLSFEGLRVRSLLEGSPVLVVGLVGSLVLVCDPRRELVARALGAMALLTIAFLCTRQNEDLLVMGNVLGWPTLGPRYLVAIEPLLLIVGAHVVHRHADRRGLVVLVTVAALVGAVTSVREASAFANITARNAGWIERVDEALPEDPVVFGHDGAMHGIHTIRAREGSVVLLDIATDDGADALRVADAFNADGRELFYFGLGLELIRESLEERYVIEPVLSDPLLWRIRPAGQ